MADRFLTHLPIGARSPLPDDNVLAWDIFPFEGEIQVKALEPAVLPEPPRDGEDGPESCSGCLEPLRGAIWADEHWRVIHLGQPSAVPVKVLLCPVGHYDLLDLPPERSAELGPMLQRVERAILALGDIARVHVNRWGDGGAHLHMWLIARPAGLSQLRGACLPFWDDILPAQDEQQWHAVLHELATTLAADGGTAYA